MRLTPRFISNTFLIGCFISCGALSACGDAVDHTVVSYEDATTAAIDDPTTPTADASTPEQSADPVSTPDATRGGDATERPQPSVDAAGPEGDDAGTELAPPPPRPEVPFSLRSAFSNTQGRVTARFSEAVGPGADLAANYTIRASNLQELTINSASPSTAAPEYVELEVDISGINPSLTYELIVKDVTSEAGEVLLPGANKARVNRTLYVNIVWHQHQPLYLDPIADQLTGPWVRKHATKDYYDMVSILEEYPNLHANVNLSSVLLRQLMEYYVLRMDPFIDVMTNTMDVEGFKAAWGGRTDPFVDFLLAETPTKETVTEEELLLVWKGPWTLVSTADAIMQHFPEYVALRDANRSLYDKDDFLKLKIWFEIAWFDPDFLNGPVELPDGSVTRVHEWLNRDGDIYTLAVPPSEQLAIDLLIEGHKIVRNTIDIHRELFYYADTREGQVEVTTTPMYHPILPLIYDTDLMGQSQPFDPRPETRFSYPEDAAAQVFRAVRFYEDVFGVAPRGMWCGEGSVAEDIVPLLVDAGLEWTATDQGVLGQSLGIADPPRLKPYRVDSDKVQGHGGDESDNILIVFRDSDLSDRMGFEYWHWPGEDAAQHFFDDISLRAPGLGGEDRLLTIILDGENAWEAYKYEHDAKGFFHAFYRKLEEGFESGELVTVTTSEYIHGNPQRAITPHPIAQQQELEPLWAGSWIGANFATWIGETEENKAWEYLRTARADLAASGLPRPNPLASEPHPSQTLQFAIYQAYDLMYAAEGSDWFWWYGVDQTTPSNDDSAFDRAFRSQLLGMYEYANEALELLGQPLLVIPEFAPLIQAKPKGLEGPYEGDYPAPVIDGAFLPSEEEWTPPGGFFFDSDSSTAISYTDDINTVYYGWDSTAFYVGIQANEDLYAKLGTPYGIAVLTDHKHIIDADLGLFESDPANPFMPPGESVISLEAGRRVMVDFSGSDFGVKVQFADGQGGWNDQPHSVSLGEPSFGGSVIELAIPWGDLGLVPQADPLNFHVVAYENDVAIDAAPSFDPKRVFDDVTNMIFVTFRVDASGTQIPVAPIGFMEPPAPHGLGSVFIVGKQDKLGDWIPNKIPMVALDNGLWEVTFGFPRGEVLNYKYTAGTSTHEGQWAGTEEFPYTNRQFLVTEDPTVAYILIEDVLGDDPPQENSMGKMSVVTESADPIE